MNLSLGFLSLFTRPLRYRTVRTVLVPGCSPLNNKSKILFTDFPFGDWGKSLNVFSLVVSTKKEWILSSPWSRLILIHSLFKPFPATPCYHATMLPYTFLLLISFSLLCFYSKSFLNQDDYLSNLSCWDSPFRLLITFNPSRQTKHVFSGTSMFLPEEDDELVTTGTRGANFCTLVHIWMPFN